MPARRLVALAAVALSLASAACHRDPEAAKKAMEIRARDAEKRIKASIPKTQEIAMTQKIDPAVVKKVQGELRSLQEYLDEPSGKIDMVTVNAIEAFQRREGMKEDGLLNEETLKRLDAAAGAKAG